MAETTVQLPAPLSWIKPGSKILLVDAASQRVNVDRIDRVLSRDVVTVHGSRFNWKHAYGDRLYRSTGSFSGTYGVDPESDYGKRTLRNYRFRMNCTSMRRGADSLSQKYGDKSTTSDIMETLDSLQKCLDSLKADVLERDAEQ